jgi:hypothetical protein
MKSMGGRGWIACEPRVAVDALSQGIPVRLLTTDELLYDPSTASEPAKGK